LIEGERGAGAGNPRLDKDLCLIHGRTQRTNAEDSDVFAS